MLELGILAGDHTETVIWSQTLALGLCCMIITGLAPKGTAEGDTQVKLQDKESLKQSY